MEYNLGLPAVGRAHLWLFATVALAAGSGVRPASAVVFQDQAAQSAGLGAGQTFLNGEARLTISLSGGGAVGCSGNLLAGGAFVLTAAHCLTNSSGTKDATSVNLYFGNTGLDVTSTNYFVDPTWNGTIAGGGDLALIKLGAPISSIAGYQLDTSSSAVGDVVTLAGYGFTGVGSTGSVSGTFGTLRYGRNSYDTVYSNAPWVYAYDFDKYGTSSYNVFGGNAVGTDEAIVAPGDSGGGSFIYTGGIWQLVGVHEFIGCVQSNCTPNSSFGQIAGDTSVYAYQSWLSSVLTPVPEPATWALLGAGFAGLGAASRRFGAKSRTAA